MAGPSVLHITDLHLLADPRGRLLDVDTQASLEVVLDHAGRSRVDAVLATGDIAHEPTSATYERFERTVRERFDVPLLALPGNHDHAAPMVAAGLPMAAIELGVWRIEPLDSHVDDQVEALVSEERLDALGVALAASSARFELVATHHPPVTVDCPWLDKDRIKNASELLDLLSEHESVRGLLFGHAHQAIDVTADSGLPLLGTPATCFQFAPRSTSFALDDQPPGYRWLHLAEDGTFSTRVVRI